MKTLSTTPLLCALEHTLCSNWLNTFCRETHQYELRRFSQKHDSNALEAKPELAGSMERAREHLIANGISADNIAVIDFLDSDKAIVAPLRHYSMSGFHAYGSPLLLIDNSDQQLNVLHDAQTLIDLITDTLARHGASGASASDAWNTLQRTPGEKAAALNQQMQNSWQAIKRYGKHRAERSGGQSGKQSTTATPISALVEAEQHLLFGHPFHVTSKSCHGFSVDDMQLYSPELGASFQLHYVAISPSLVCTQSLMLDNSVFERYLPPEVCQSLPSDYAHYTVLPLHPWQANYLSQQTEIQQLQQQGLYLHLGAMGEMVWPSSSVRTVWLPKERVFLKLALNVRITNFLRNNPPEHGKRALDASCAIRSLPIALWRSSQFQIVLEEGYQYLDCASEELQAATMTIYRQGMCDSLADSAQVLASLLEEPLTDLPPDLMQGDSGASSLLLQQLQQAAASKDMPLNARLVDLWWQQYLQISLLPLLRLYAQTGISLEAHLQNCMLACENGWPARFFVRDMEGVSISASRYFNQDNTVLAENSPALYGEAEAWFRFKYYVIVNHIAHVIASLSRLGMIDEARLWHAVDLQLDNLMFPEERALIHHLRTELTLPAKANMLSCFGQHGELPSWGYIPNPLQQLSACRSVCQDNKQSSVSDDGQAQPLSTSGEYQRAQRRVIRQVLEALVFEQVISPASWEGKRLEFDATSACGQTIRYRCLAVKSPSFARVRLLNDGVERRLRDKAETVFSVGQLLSELTLNIQVEASRWQQFIAELEQTVVNHAQSLRQHNDLRLKGGCGEFLEAHLSDGHPYHPTFKSRIGFTPQDSERYSPELSRGVYPLLLAVKVSHCHWSMSRTLAPKDFLYAEMDHSQRQLWEFELKRRGLSSDDYLPLPVHPWQWNTLASRCFQQAVDQAHLVVIGPMQDRYLPQQSIRTLSNIDAPEKHYLKLSMSLLNTSTSRVLAPHTVYNAALISDWLEKIIDSDDVLDEPHKPVLLKEVAGVGYNAPDDDADQYGALACIWRQSLYQTLDTAQQHAVPLQSLMTIDNDGRPFIDDWIQQHGVHKWLTQLVERVYLPVLHLLWKHGVALESHAQNMGLVHDHGLAERAILKDFHDGVRFSRQWLSQPEWLPELKEAPAEHRRINPNSYLETNSASELRDFVYDALFFVNLAELAWLLERFYQFSETQFWSLTSQVIKDYQQRNPTMCERFALFDVFCEKVAIEKLASRRFLATGDLHMIESVNPLFTAS